MLRGFALLLTFLVVPSLALAAPVVESFAGFPAGTVIAGALPLGGVAPGTAVAGITVTVSNNGGGPHSCIVFDSANPTGGDPDLGTPNGDFAGPGVGNGGKLGMPGENNTAMGNLLIVAEDIVDTNSDNVVDDPDDEAGGGVIDLVFDDLVVVNSVTIIDIDNESMTFTLEEGLILKGTASASDLGDNSAQTIDLSSYGVVTCLRLDFSSSGAVAEVVYTPQVVPTEDTTWGEIKSGFGEKQ